MRYHEYMMLSHLSRFVVSSLTALGVLAVILLGTAALVRAVDPVQDLQNQINETQKLLELSVNATTPLEAEVKRLGDRMASAQNTIAQLRVEQTRKQEEIEQREEELSDQYAVFSSRVDQQYRFGRTYSPLVMIFGSLESNQNRQAIKYTLTLAERDQQSIDSIGANILDLQRAKTEAAAKEKQLASLQVQLDSQKQFFEKEIAGAKAYQSTLRNQIASLTARQQSIIASKTGTATTSVGDIPLVGDPASRPDYNPGFSPAFAVFSFGAPHYKGMSQYGAYGRAKAGQSYETILKAYYGDVTLEKIDSPGSISVDGVGTIPFEDQYLKGIAEMPAQWANDGGYEALKAQAIAARTYALNSTGWSMNDRSIKRSICATEACQVYTNTKFNAGGRWHDAVNDTKGIVIKSNSSGNIFSTMYASTSGGHQMSYTSQGHSTPALWDTTSSWNNWVDGAYEKLAGSPWFYKGWYADRGGDSCGRSHPWLTEKEFADILNAWVVRRNASGGDLDRISPLGGCWGGNPYSLDEMREKAKSYGEEYTSVSGVRVTHNSNGTTNEVVLQTNRGEVKINGTEFKETFNLRAPGRIAIKGKLFGIEKK